MLCSTCTLFDFEVLRHLFVLVNFPCLGQILGKVCGCICSHHNLHELALSVLSEITRSKSCAPTHTGKYHRHSENQKY